VDDLCAYAGVAFGPKRATIDLDVPPEAVDVWNWFMDLDRTRQVGMQANPISYQEIEAYARLTGAEIAPWEARAIRRLDDIALSTKRPKGGKGAKERDPDVLVSAKDGAGVSGLLKGLAAKAPKKKAG
jgi:hypothetical protein